MQLWAPAKVNLSFEVKCRRPDGFHEIETLMVPISLKDRLTIEITPADAGIRFSCDDPSLPTGDDNLVVSAAKLFREKTGNSAGIEINSALIMKTIAAAIVSFDRTDAVPRGPNAALETLLVNKAPASVLPGCRSTAVTSTKQATKKIVYKTYSNLLGPPLPPDGGNQNYL